MYEYTNIMNDLLVRVLLIVVLKKGALILVVARALALAHALVLVSCVSLVRLVIDTSWEP